MQPQQYILPGGTELHGRYRIEHTISQGGFGNVYLARDHKFNREVAIKEAYLSDEETHKQFSLEAEVLIHTNHVGVVRGFEEFEANGRFYLVMEYIAGQNMEDMQIAHFKAYRRPLPENVVLPMMALICAATQALHDGKVLHRDIKPANVKVNGAGQPILLDLGLAKLYHDPTSVTLIAARAYTPGYAPPEQCEDGGSTTAVTDVYALGATTYYALTGRQPWDAVRRLTEYAQGHPDMPPPSFWLPEISAATDALVMRALALDPSKRFPNVRDMQRAVEQAYKAISDRTLCPNCHFLNAAGAEYCGSCGVLLKEHGAQGSAQSVIKAGVEPVAHPSEVLMQPAPHPPTAPMPARPEPVAPRAVVMRPPQRSVMAGIVLALGVGSLCPAAVWFSLINIPLGLVAIRNISRSGGVRRGMPQATIGLLLSVFSLVGAIIFIYLTVTGTIHPFS